MKGRQETTQQGNRLAVGRLPDSWASATQPLGGRKKDAGASKLKALTKDVRQGRSEKFLCVLVVFLPLSTATAKHLWIQKFRLCGLNGSRHLWA